MVEQSPVGMTNQLVVRAVQAEGTERIGLNQEIGNEEGRARVGSWQQGAIALDMKKKKITELHSGWCKCVGYCFET